MWLLDIWCDFPNEVTECRDKHRLKDEPHWKEPALEDVKHWVGVITITHLSTWLLKGVQHLVKDVNMNAAQLGEKSDFTLKIVKRFDAQCPTYKTFHSTESLHLKGHTHRWRAKETFQMIPNICYK